MSSSDSQQSSRQSPLGSCGFDLTVDLSSNKKHEAGDIEPGEQNNHRAKRPVRNSIGIKELDAPIFRSSVSRSGEYVQKSREVTLAEELVDSGQGDRPVEDTLQDKVLIDYIDGLLEKSNLSEREAEVIRLRFGFYDGVEHTLEETSQVFNVTRERIRQLETKALTKLRHPERSKELKEYL